MPERPSILEKRKALRFQITLKNQQPTTMKQSKQLTTKLKVVQ